MIKKQEIDLTFLKEFCRGDKKKMTQYIHTFLEESPEQIDIITKNTREKNWSAVKMAAHALQPQASFVGLTRVKELLEKIESSAANENFSSVPILVNELESAM